MFKRGFFDELIYHVNQKIEASPADKRASPDPRLLYFRGLAYFKLGWFERAKVDLIVAEKAGVAEIEPGWGANWVLYYIKQRTPVLPPKMEEIRQGERVLFRMHSFGMENGTVFVKALLPEAYRVSRQMFGTDVEATTVYVFDDYAQFAAYYEKHTGEKHSGWIDALTIGDLVLISLSDQEGTSLARDDRDFFKTTIVHEINHALFHRLMGWAEPPSWFVEGLAQVAGAQVSQDYVASKQQRLNRIFRNNVLLPIEKLEDADEFYAQTELGVTMSKGRDRDKAPDPYTQGYAMVKYLLDNISTPQFQSFLNRVRESNDFKGSFANEFGMTTAQFYEKWRADTARQLAMP